MHTVPLPPRPVEPNPNPLAHIPAGKLSGELLEVLSHFIDATERCRVLDDVVAALTGREHVPTEKLRETLAAALCGIANHRDIDRIAGVR